MALGKVSRNEQSCRACKFLQFEVPGVSPGQHVALEFEGIAGEPVCKLNKIDFIDILGLDDHHEMNNRIPELRNGEFIEIKNHMYRMQPATGDRVKANKVDTDPEAASRLVRSMGIEWLDDDISEAELFGALIAHGIDRTVILQETIDKDAYESGDYADFIKWQDVIPADPTVDYIHVGTRYKSIIEPFLAEQGCAFGINKTSGIAFSKFIDAEHTHNRVRHLAKELWGNDIVLTAVKEHSPLTVCSCCGFPMPAERSEIYLPVPTGRSVKVQMGIDVETRPEYVLRKVDYCVWCSEELYEGKLSGNSSIHHRYFIQARERMAHDRQVATVASVPSLCATPVVMASRLNMKLAAFFKKTGISAAWTPKSERS